MHDADFPLAHDIQAAIFPRALFQDFLAGADPLHSDASRQFLQLAFVDLALEVEQMTDQAARRADRDAVRRRTRAPRGCRR